MARIEVHDDRVLVQLTRSERIAAVHGKNIVLDRSAISSAVLTDDPWVWIRGVRAPGLEIPFIYAIGTYRTHAGKDFVLARQKSKAVVLDFDLPESEDHQGGGDPGADRETHDTFDRFARVILSTSRAEELIRALRVAP